ncbi:MAG: hypothetical protein IT370_32405 [Deltaproteobacteria bacterium]|nr:hypothetical protein [Deltaproteobacteria bacterium]
MKVIRFSPFLLLLVLSGFLGVMANNACSDSGGDSIDSGMTGDAANNQGLCARCTATQKCCAVGGVMACVDTARDKNNCGMCGEKCEATVADTCTQSQCVCALGPKCTGSKSCCGTGSNPGCKDLSADAFNCGMCGKACKTGEVCMNSGCLCGGATPRTCTANETCCGGASPGCIDTKSDPNNCGGCGVKCPMVDGRQLMCDNGACKCGVGGNMCPTAGGPLGGTPVLGCCGTTCVDLCTDGMNCGGCANSCGAPPLNICLGGSCFSGSPTYDAGVPMGCTGLPFP